MNNEALEMFKGWTKQAKETDKEYIKGWLKERMYGFVWGLELAGDNATANECKKIYTGTFKEG